MLGMIIGDTSYISDEVEGYFRISGITHLLAVSGSNVAYIILFTKFLFDRIFGKKVSNYFVIIFVIIFMFVSGCSASVVRATIMAIILIVADILSEKSNIYTSIATSMIIMLLYNPILVVDVGFILSYGGTLGIVLLYEKINNYLKEKFNIKNKFLIYVVEILSTTLSAQIILFPVMWYLFNSISLISIITNLLVAPISGLLTILGIITYILGIIYFPLAKFFSYSVFTVSNLIINIAKICSSVPYAEVLVPTPSFLIILIYYLIVYKIFYQNQNKILSYFILIMCIVQIFLSIYPSGYLSVNFVDVGQGDCTYIETSNKKTILIDGGGTENSDYDVGEKVLIPYLLDKGKNKIDVVVISHFHADHMEGIINVIDKLKVGKLIIGPCNVDTELYKEVIKIADNKGVEVSFVRARR